MSYVFAVNEYTDPFNYTEKLWELTQINRRAGHKPANKTGLTSAMHAELFKVVYVGGDSLATFSSKVDLLLEDPDRPTAVNAALTYYSTT